MTYLPRRAAQRKERARIMRGATAAVVTLTNYRHDPGPPAQGQPRVAQYAQSADYHRVLGHRLDRKSTRLNSSHSQISYAVFCLKKKRGLETLFGQLPAGTLASLAEP